MVMITFKTIVSQDNNLKNKCFYSRCMFMEKVVDVVW
jgi:hypothetical protein